MWVENCPWNHRCRTFRVLLPYNRHHVFVSNYDEDSSILNPAFQQFYPSPFHHKARILLVTIAVLVANQTVRWCEYYRRRFDQSLNDEFSFLQTPDQYILL